MGTTTTTTVTNVESIKTDLMYIFVHYVLISSYRYEQQVLAGNCRFYYM